MKQRILVAEDDPSILTAVTDLLEGEGFTVDPARDGAEALSRYAEAKPDLVLLDIMMPGRSGLTLTAPGMIQRMESVHPANGFFPRQANRRVQRTSSPSLR